MKVFISWSGPLSLKIAEALRDWLPSVIQITKPYVSSEDIYKGTRWSVDISRELEASDYGILCVTADNITAPWLNFEAGALSKSFEKSHVSPFLFGIDRDAVTGPLMQFQSTIYQYSDVLRLIKSINKASSSPLETIRIEKDFNVWWPKLKELIDPLEGVRLNKDSIEESTQRLEEMITELLHLARTQQKTLSGTAEVQGARVSNSKSPVKVIKGVDSGEVTLLLGRLHAAAECAVKPGRPETPLMVQLRALVMLLEDTLAPLIEKPAFESVVRRYEEKIRNSTDV